MKVSTIWTHYIRRFLSFAKLLSVAHFIVYDFAQRHSNSNHCNQKQEFLQFISVDIYFWQIERWIANE